MIAQDTIDRWRLAHWGQRGACDECGDPVILADTEDWPLPLCFECWDALSPADRHYRASMATRAVR